MKIETTPGFNEPHNYVENMKLANDYFTRDGSTIFGDARPVYNLLLEHGEEFTGSMSPPRMMLPQHCFHNAWILARVDRKRELKYVEGYASTGIIPVHHAWCVDSDGVVIEPTWAPEKRLDESHKMTGRTSESGSMFSTNDSLSGMRRSQPRACYMKSLLTSQRTMCYRSWCKSTNLSGGSEMKWLILAVEPDTNVETFSQDADAVYTTVIEANNAKSAGETVRDELDSKELLHPDDPLEIWMLPIDKIERAMVTAPVKPSVEALPPFSQKPNPRAKRTG